MSKILISIITHSRPEGLESTLKSLQSQKLILNNSLEICVIDNDCTGQNDAIVEKLDNNPYKIHLIKEFKKGIVYARNTAIDYFLENDFDALAFIDDDEWTLDEFWLQNLMEAQELSKADIVTSDVFTQPETEKINWTTIAMGRTLSKTTSNLSEVSKFYTGNVLIMKNVLQTVKPAFDERFAMTGSSDYHFSLKCRNAGFKAIYTNKAPVIEIFPESKARLKWFFMRGFRNGSGASLSHIYEMKSKSVYLKILFMSGARLLHGLWYTIKAALYFNKGYLAIAITRIGSSIGSIFGIFNINYNEYKKIHGK